MGEKRGHQGKVAGGGGGGKSARAGRSLAFPAKRCAGDLMGRVR
jgi:hypothetical protein